MVCPTKFTPPILQYLGHVLAHPQWAHRAGADYVALVQSDLAQYASVLMNGWERAQLVNFVLMPHWMHRLIFLPSDKMFHRIDTMVSEFVRQPKGMETSSNHHLLGTPVRDGGLGLRYIYWAYHKRFITSMQHTLRAHPDLFPFLLDKVVPCTQTPLLAYVSLLQSLGAIPGISLQPVKRRPCGPELFDSEDTEDGRLLVAQQPKVGQPFIAMKYCSPSPVWYIHEHGGTPTGFKSPEVCGYEVYTNETPPVGNSWHSDGRKLLVTPDCQGSPQGSRAGMALTCGPFQCIARVHGPQTSYRAELMGLSVVAHLVAPGSTITLDNQAVVVHGPLEHQREASDIHLRSRVSGTLREKNIRVRWIPGHRKSSSARNAQELDDIKRNNEVDLLAKLAMSLPLPIHNPTGPSSISVGGTEALTPGSKWIATTRPY